MNNHLISAHITSTQKPATPKRIRAANASFAIISFIYSPSISNSMVAGLRLHIGQVQLVIPKPFVNTKVVVGNCHKAQSHTLRCCGAIYAESCPFAIYFQYYAHTILLYHPSGLRMLAGAFLNSRFIVASLNPAMPQPTFVSRNSSSGWASAYL